MNAKKLAIAAVAVAALVGAASAEARGRDDVQWSITIGSPAPWAVQTVPAPAFYARSFDRRDGYRTAPTRWDRDGDGIPNRYDRVYNPRWDRDGDGIPNRYDRRDDRRFGRDGHAVPRW
jgi:hypothetical protein